MGEAAIILNDNTAQDSEDIGVSRSHYQAYNPQKEAKRQVLYPVTWIVDQDHKVTQIGAYDETGGSTNTCKGAQCQNKKDAAVNEFKDEL